MIDFDWYFFHKVIKYNHFFIRKMQNIYISGTGFWIPEDGLTTNDEVVKSALPDEMLKVFMHYKRDEWEKFLSAVTQWDVDTYLDILP